MAIKYTQVPEKYMFQPGDILEFTGSEKTKLAAYQPVIFHHYSGETAKVTFPEGSEFADPDRLPVRNGSLPQWVEITALRRYADTSTRIETKISVWGKQQVTDKTPTLLQGTETMSLKITTSHKVNGVETSALTAELQAEMIAAQQKRIDALEKVEAKTKQIKAAIKELREELSAFVAHLDSLPEKK